jgi:hypothetical protein|uniref:Uncharacterized protein n=1 Tax=viral metagenome TaxID=1070528 RepID=A0A6C0CDR0_9ZZZZ
MSDTVTRLQYNKLFELDKVSNSNISPGVPPYIITSVTLRSLITKFLEERKRSKPLKSSAPAKSNSKPESIKGAERESSSDCVLHVRVNST